MICPNCKKENPEGAVFCTYCGTKLIQSEQPPANPNGYSQNNIGGYNQNNMGGYYNQGNYNGYNQGNYNPYNNYQQPQSDPSDTGSAGWGVLGAFIPLVGLILFLTWRSTAPKNSKAAGIGAIIGVCIQVFLGIFLGILFATVLNDIFDGPYYYYSLQSFTSMLIK